MKNIDIILRAIELKKQAIQLFINEIVDLEIKVLREREAKEYYSNEK